MKRRIIALVTFVAGLYYVLEFLVPPHIGGAPDAAGAFGACFDKGAGRALLLYSGIRPGGAPRILQTPYPAENGPIETILAPSPLRAADYYGAMNPQLLGDRLYYIGRDWEDRIPGLCIAWRKGSRWVPRGRPILQRGAPGSWAASGITWASVLPPAGDHLWRVWYVGRQGDLGRIGFGTSREGTHWITAPQPVLSAEPGTSVESVSVVVRHGRLGALVVLKDRGSGIARLGWAWLSWPSGSPLGPLSDVVIQRNPVRYAWQAAVPTAVHDARIVDDGDIRQSSIRVLLSVQGDQGRMFLAEALGALPKNPWEPIVLLLKPQPVKMPGKQPVSTVLSDVRDRVDDLMVVIGAFAIGLGLVSLAQVHGGRIRRLAPGWPESCAFFAAAGGMTFFTLYTRLHPRAGAWASAGYGILFFGLLQPLGSSMFALLAAYLVSAAYRAFRIRNVEASLMALAAVLVMLGQVPVGHSITRGLPDALQIPTIMAWVLYVANNAVVRAINFGIFVGAIATALRIWLSLDRGFDAVG